MLSLAKHCQSRGGDVKVYGMKFSKNIPFNGYGSMRILDIVLFNNYESKFIKLWTTRQSIRKVRTLLI